MSVEHLPEFGLEGEVEVLRRNFLQLPLRSTEVPEPNPSLRYQQRSLVGNLCNHLSYVVV
jgi:hypothetical protein